MVRICRDERRRERRGEESYPEVKFPRKLALRELEDVGEESNGIKGQLDPPLCRVIEPVGDAKVGDGQGGEGDGEEVKEDPDVVVHGEPGQGNGADPDNADDTDGGLVDGALKPEAVKRDMKA